MRHADMRLQLLYAVSHNYQSFESYLCSCLGYATDRPPRYLSLGPPIALFPIICADFVYVFKSGFPHDTRQEL